MRRALLCSCDGLFREITHSPKERTGSFPPPAMGLDLGEPLRVTKLPGLWGTERWEAVLAA